MASLAVACRVACASALAGAWTLAWAAPASAPAGSLVSRAPGCHGTEDSATTRLMARVRREHLYESWTKADCLQYLLDRCTARTVDISLHEDHAVRCGGDPATSPRVDSFRVYRRGKRIDWYNVVNDTWRPFDKIHAEGGR